MKRSKVRIWLVTILMILMGQLSAEFVELVNRHYGDPNSNLGGTLTILNLDVPGSDPITVTSGHSVEVIIGNRYTITTTSEYLQGEKHLMWNDTHSEYRLVLSEYNIQSYDIEYGISAYFKDQNSVINSSPLSIQIKDPWLVNDAEEQTGEDWLVFEDIYSVFLMRNELFNETDPIYSIKAPAYYADMNGIYAFSHWVGTDISFNESGAMTTTDRETDVVFLSETAAVTAHYDMGNHVNTIDNYFISTETLFIPSGAAINFAEGVRIYVDEKLIINGTELQPVSLTSQAPEWNGIEINSPGLVKIDYTTIEHAAIGLEITDYWDQTIADIKISNSSFKNNGYSLYFHNINNSHSNILIHECEFEKQNNNHNRLYFRAIDAFLDIQKCLFTKTTILFEHVMSNMNISENIFNLENDCINSYGIDILNSRGKFNIHHNLFRACLNPGIIFRDLPGLVFDDFWQTYFENAPDYVDSLFIQDYLNERSSYLSSIQNNTFVDGGVRIYGLKILGVVIRITTI